MAELTVCIFCGKEPEKPRVYGYQLTPRRKTCYCIDHSCDNGLLVSVHGFSREEVVEKWNKIMSAADVAPVARCKDCKMNPVEMYIFKKALAHYGPEAQIKMLYEEMAELQLAVCKHGRGADNLDNIAEELADVGIMLDQMRLLFDVAPLSEAKRGEKVARLAERMDRDEDR